MLEGIIIYRIGAGSWGMGAGVAPCPGCTGQTKPAREQAERRPLLLLSDLQLRDPQQIVRCDTREVRVGAKLALLR